MAQSKTDKGEEQGVRSVKILFSALREKLDDKGTLSKGDYHDLFAHSSFASLEFENVFYRFKSDIVFCKYLLQEQKQLISGENGRKYIADMLEEHPKADPLWGLAICFAFDHHFNEKGKKELMRLLS